MVLAKAGSAQTIAQQTGLKKTSPVTLTKRSWSSCKENPASGEDVLINGFGKFCVKEKSERHGRNPSTDDPMMLLARRVVTFKCSGKLRDLCNEGMCWAGISVSCLKNPHDLHMARYMEFPQFLIAFVL